MPVKYRQPTRDKAGTVHPKVVTYKPKPQQPQYLAQYQQPRNQAGTQTPAWQRLRARSTNRNNTDMAQYAGPRAHPTNVPDLPQYQAPVANYAPVTDPVAMMQQYQYQMPRAHPTNVPTIPQYQMPRAHPTNVPEVPAWAMAAAGYPGYVPGQPGLVPGAQMNNGYPKSFVNPNPVTGNPFGPLREQHRLNVLARNWSFGSPQPAADQTPAQPYAGYGGGYGGYGGYGGGGGYNFTPPMPNIPEWLYGLVSWRYRGGQ